jgi:hypothetical protein
MNREENSICANGISISVFLDDENPEFFGINLDGKPITYDSSLIGESGVIQYFSTGTPHDALDVIIDLLQ